MRHPNPPSPSQRATRYQRLLTLNPMVYREIDNDAAATVEAVLTAAVVFFLSGVGGWLWLEIEEVPVRDFFVQSVLIGTATGTGMFLVWAGLVTASAGGFAQGQTVSAIIRTLAYASVPYALSFFIWLPGFEFEITMIAVALLIISMAQATQAALALPFGRAVGLNLIGFTLWASVLNSLMGGSDQLAPGIFLWDLFNVL